MLAVILAGGFLSWHDSRKNPLTNASQASGGLVSADQSSDSSGLSVSSGANLGQLGGNQSQSGSSSNNSSNSSGSSSGLDPSTFTQYDKYKSSQSALFGDIKVGSGAALTSGHKAEVYYKGWLTNGTLIDQSPASASGQPQAFAFTLGAHEVIPGWEEAIYGMKAGGTRLMIIPPAVGYGAQGKGLVPPNAVLIFEVQLLSVQ